MGVVVLVEHIELRQRMAIKLMIPGVSHDTQNVERFVREARAAAGIQSEHVVRIFDVGTFDTGAPYMVMELLRGEDLGQLLTSVGRLPIHEAVDYTLQACLAIAEAHAMGIVHRDLKPSNLFLTRRSDGTALIKVLDFGISKAMNPDKEGPFSANLTATSAVMGSPLYMSPEQVRNAKQVDARADVWSLGVILHELLTGAPAFNADTLPGICAAIIADEPAPLRSLRPDAPAELEMIVCKCLEKSVNRRFQNVRELMAALRGFSSKEIPLSPGSRQISAATLPSNDSSGLAQARGMGHSRARDTQLAPSNPAAPSMGARSVPSQFERSAAPVASSRLASVASPSAKSRKPIIAGALVAAAAMASMAAFALRGREAPAPAVSAASKVEQAPAARKTFTLFIDSTPGGASVIEGDAVLGNTPLQISVDNEAAHKDARKLTIRRDGFQPYSIVQGPSEDNVRIVAALVESPAEAPALASAAKGHAPPPAAAHVAKAVKTAAPPPPEPSPKAPPPPPAPAPNPDDIRLQR
jgi:serine/threonine-protein kinase